MYDNCIHACGIGALRLQSGVFIIRIFSIICHNDLFLSSHRILRIVSDGWRPWLGNLHYSKLTFMFYVAAKSLTFVYNYRCGFIVGSCYWHGCVCWGVVVTANAFVADLFVDADCMRSIRKNCIQSKLMFTFRNLHDQPKRLILEPTAFA